MQLAAALCAILTLTILPARAGLFETRRAQCLQCHGDNGASPTPEVPSLGGMPELFTLLQLVAFREGNRKVEIMNEMMKGMTDDDLRAAAAFVARLPPPPPPAEAGDPARMARGRALAQQHRCGVCHNEDFSGREQMPRLAHQREDYLLKALRDYKSQKRIGGGAMMIEVLHPLDDAALVDLAHYLAHVP